MRTDEYDDLPEEFTGVKYELGETKVVVHCDAHDVEIVLEKEYGFKEYSIVASEECGNYCSLEFTVDGEIDKWDEKELKDRKELYCTRLYLNDLARQGKIQKGFYIIDVSW